MNEKKVAIVTGASRGLGRQIALTLADANYRVVVNYNSSHKCAEETLELIKSKGGEAIAYQGSVANPDDMKSMVEKTLEHYGSVDILVNNAGILIPQYLMMTTLDDWNKTIETNLTGSFLSTKSVLRPMIENKYGRIINISSVASFRGLAGQAAYAASKSGMDGMTKVLAKELSSYNILVNSIAPGFIDTDMTDEFPERILEEYRESIPLKRFGAPEDIANFVVYLASDKANYITGQTFTIDGGLSV